MSRWIDADALIEKINTAFWSEIGKVIDDLPSIDIVRCKECKKANTKDCSHSYWDDDWGEWRVGYKGDEWFCADGERRTDG